MFDLALYDYIKANFDLTDFDNALGFGSAKGLTIPYLILNKVIDTESREFFSDVEGETGNALIRFTNHAGGTNNPANNAYTVKILNDFKKQFNKLNGLITSINGNYIINSNRTEGVILLENKQLNRCGAVFQSRLGWQKA